MITVTRKEAEYYIDEAIATLCVKAWDLLIDMESGCDADISSIQETLISLRAMEHYRTGKFAPEVYFNVITPNGFHSLFTRSNQI